MLRRSRPPEQTDYEAFRYAISEKAFMDETESVQILIDALEPLQQQQEDILRHATTLTERLRKEGSGSGLEAFLHEYGLNTTEGVAIMCLSEALLRIPDTETADRLIRDKFEHAEWERHLGNSESLFVNASSWGLMLTGKTINLGSKKPVNFIGQMVDKFGEPVIREALKKGMRFIGSQFVMGETMKEALANSRKPAKKGYRFSYDILGESARNEEQAQGYIKAYQEAIALIGEKAQHYTLSETPNISLKLTALHPRYMLGQHDRVLEELKPRLYDILRKAMHAGVTVTIDAEESTRLDLELELLEHIVKEPEFKDWNGLGFVVQAYMKRAYYVIDYLAKLSREHKRIFPLRLVKGAYWDTEIKQAQLAGLSSYPVFTRKEHTDVSYLACAQKIFSYLDCFFPQFGTHNARTVSSIMVMAKNTDAPKGSYEFQRLYGMGEKLYNIVIKEVPCRIYSPVGEHKDLLAYLIRRLLENGANTSFVNLLMDKNTPVPELLADPVRRTLNQGASPNPRIPDPAELYLGTRENSAGLDMGNMADVRALETALAAFAKRKWEGASLLADAKAGGTTEAVHEPADSSITVGTVQLATADDVKNAVDRAGEAFKSWSKTEVETRARALEKAAELIEAHRDEFLSLLGREAGRIVPDGIAEVREAADFCRYYAWQARRVFQAEELVGPTGESNTLSLHPRGTFACISPWNFPLAIFTGQIVAALVTGNTVVAKPAEQTPIVAYRAVQLLHEAGIPKDVLQLVLGDGAEVGAPLVANEKIAGVVFTGSVETAKHIQRSLAERKGAIVPFIAETGGQNCMVVDSSALLEQATDDILLSAFSSAGQRCSALRVLMVQDDIADALLNMIAGAMQELKVGYPLEISTDVGPVIDKDAQAMLLEHIEAMKKEAKLVSRTPLPESLSKHGMFVSPHLFEINSLQTLKREVFGPVLHVVRFKNSELHNLPQRINATGYGLTFGIQSRIEDHVEYFVDRVHAGNIYVNRNMIGATVGVQPFGGEGLSGTGPKAGGPHYLYRFISERTTTINTAAIGGNVALLSEGDASSY